MFGPSYEALWTLPKIVRYFLSRLAFKLVDEAHIHYFCRIHGFLKSQYMTLLVIWSKLYSMFVFNLLLLSAEISSLQHLTLL